MPTYRAVLYLPTGVPQLDTLEFSTTGPTGPWTSVTLTAPRPIVGNYGTTALTEWSSLATAALGFTVILDFTETQMVMYAASACYARLSASQAELFGYANMVHKISGSPKLSDSTPAGWCALAGASATPPAPRDKATLYEFRGGRFDSYSTMRETWHRVELLVPEAAIDALENSTLLRSGLHAIALGDPFNAYDGTDFDGVLTCTPVPESLRIERVEGEGDDAVISFDAVAGRT